LRSLFELGKNENSRLCYVFECHCSASDTHANVAMVPAAIVLTTKCIVRTHI
jgi:hypothetical protein